MSSESLTEAVDRLAEEVRTLHLVMEEIRACFERAVNNDRLRGFEPDDDPDLKALVFDLREKTRIVGLAMNEVRQVPKSQVRLFNPD